MTDQNVRSSHHHHTSYHILIKTHKKHTVDHFCCSILYVRDLLLRFDDEGIAAAEDTLREDGGSLA